MEPRQRAVLAGVATVGAGGIVGLLRWKLWSSAVPAAEDHRLADWFDPARVRDRHYREGL